MADEDQSNDQANDQPNDQPVDPASDESAGDPSGVAGEDAQPDAGAEDAMDDEAAAALAAAMAAINMTQSDANSAIEQAMLEAMRDDPGAPSVAERAASGRAKPNLTGAAPMSLADLAATLGAGRNKDTLDLLSDVQLHVRVELGRTRMYVEDILQLGTGAVVELDKLAGDPVDVYVNERHVARGEVLVLNENFCIRVNEILDPGDED